MKLGVNIDHVATLRQARGGRAPSPREAALEAQKGGADGITLHLREDRRHIQDSDLSEIKRACRVPLNLEMALADEIIAIALRLRPEKVCIVPEKRREVTTEGGLDVVRFETKLRKVIPQFRKKKIEVSLFIDAVPRQIQASARVEAAAIEIHTGTYSIVRGRAQSAELARVKRGAELASGLGLHVNAGHGLDYQNVGRITQISRLRELNIGHSIVSRAVFVGMKEAVREMKNLIQA